VPVGSQAASRPLARALLATLVLALGACRATSPWTASPLDPGDGVATVLVFVTVDCPISNQYAPTIRALAEEFSPRGVRFQLVHVDPDVTPERAVAHAAEFDLALPIVMDPQHRLVRLAGVRVTPEVAVYARGDRAGAVDLVYRGWIDDRYAELGKKRQVVTTHDLRDVLRTLVDGERLEPRRTEAVGCLVPVLP